jgi:cysteinyl-tRNA synthetase
MNNARSDIKEDTFSISNQEIEDIIEKRKEAKRNKNWTEGDSIRDELKTQGIILIDQAHGEVKWHRN